MFNFLIEPGKSPHKYLKAVRAINAFVRKGPGFSKSKNFSPSGLGRMCSREYVFNYFDPREYPADDMKSGLRMGVGQMVHKRIQDSILGPMGLLYGKWVHEKTGEVLENCYRPKEKGWKFRERKIKIQIESGATISSFIDGEIDKNRFEWFVDGCKGDPPEIADQFYLWEFKTMNPNTYADTRGVDDLHSDYKMQAEVYQNITGTFKTIFWILSTADYSGRFIEYDYTGEWWKTAELKMQVCLEAIDKLHLPIAYKACETKDDHRAKRCPFREECFGDLNFEEWVKSLEKE